jgi:hypothetical protein
MTLLKIFVCTCHKFALIMYCLQFFIFYLLLYVHTCSYMYTSSGLWIGGGVTK